MEDQSDKSKKKLKVGKDSVVMGDISGEVGDGSVVIGPTDANGNVILNSSMAIGRGAFAGPGSIAIGAGAGAGSEILMVLNQLDRIVQNSGDQDLIKNFTSFCIALKNPNQNKSGLLDLWEAVKISATLNGSITLIQKVTQWLALIPM